MIARPSSRRLAALVAASGLALAALAPLALATAAGLTPIPTRQLTGVRTIGVAAGANTVYVATSSGLFRSVSADYSQWTRQDTRSTIRLLSVNARHPESLLFATDNGLYRSTDGGATATTVKTCVPTDLARSYQQPSVIFATAAAYSCGLPSILKSVDDGLTWTTVYTRPIDYENYEAFNHVAVDPGTDNHVIASKIDYHMYGELYDSTDGGTTWVSTVHYVPVDYTPINALAINPHAPYDMWLAWSRGDVNVGPTVLEHYQGGQHQSAALDLGKASGIPTQEVVNAVLYDPLSARTYVDVGGTAQGQSATPSIYAAEGAPTTFRRVLLHGHPAGTNAAITQNGYLLTGDAATPLTVEAITGTGMWGTAPAIAASYGPKGAVAWLGQAISPETTCGGQPCQYFVKGASAVQGNGRYILVGLVSRLIGAQSPLPVGGSASTITYKALHAVHGQRTPAPFGFHGGTMSVAGGIFVPYSPTLAPAAGYVVPLYFWRYMADPSTSPDGWQRDIGLPLTPAVAATVSKGRLGTRQIMLQAFQDTVLTYDPRNPASFRVERANVGSDYAAAFPRAVR